MVLGAASARQTRVMWTCLAFATLYGAGLVVAGFFAPAYDTVSATSSGAVVHGSATLVGENGPGAVAVLCVPLMLSVLVALALSWRSRTWAMRIAWVLTAALAVANVLALMTIGLFVFPVTIALVIACATARSADAALIDKSQPN
jgi:hypothetical protein